MSEPQAASATPAPAANPIPAIDPTKIRQVKEWKFDRPLLGCRLDSTSKYAAAAGQDFFVRRVELANDQNRVLAGHRSWIRALAFQPEGNLLVSGDYAGRLIGWRYSSPDPEATAFDVAAHDGWVRAVAFSPDGQSFASCGNDHLVRLWSSRDGKLLGELAGHDQHVYNVAFHPSGTHLVSADLKGVVIDWDLGTRSIARKLDSSVLWKFDGQFQADIGGIRGIAFSTDGKLLACSGMTEVSNAFAGVGFAIVVVLDWESGQTKGIYRPKDNLKGTAWGVAFHPSGTLVAVTNDYGNGKLWFFKMEETAPFFEFPLPSGGRDIHLSPDGTKVAVAHLDSALRLYDLTPPAA